jgi:hypothetical protein
MPAPPAPLQRLRARVETALQLSMAVAEPNARQVLLASIE